MLKWGVHTGVEAFDTLRPDWEALERTSPSATPFQTWTWQRTWWTHFGGLRNPLFFTLHEGNDLVGLMPMVRNLGPWRTVRPMGIGPSDYLHPLAREGYEDDVAERLVACLSERSDIDLIDLHQVRETRALASCAGGTEMTQATCLVLDLPATYDAFVAGLSKSLRYDVRKLDKSLFQSGRAQIEVCDPADVDRGLDILFELHRRRWRERKLPGAFLGRTVPFHREWAHAAAERGWLNLGILKLDGEPIGAIYAMALGRTAYYYQAGFDPAHGAVSPGTLLVAHAIRQSIEEGRESFDFMRGDESYKRRWKPQRELRNLRFVLPAGGALGRMGSSWNLAGGRLESRIRARLEGRGLW